MRVLHVHSGNLYGGVETILATLVRRRRDCPELQHQFALCFEGRLSAELLEAGAPLHSLGAVRVSKPLSILRARRELKKLLRERVFDAVVFHSAWSHAIFGPVARASRKPSVVWMHGTTAGKHWTERWSCKSDPDLIVCNSRFTSCNAAEVYRTTSRRVLYCPVELNSAPLMSSERKAIRKWVNTAEDAVVIMQVSRIERCKGQLLHLEALSRLKAIPKWTCWFVGGPQRAEEEAYFEEIRRQTVRLGVEDRVRLLDERIDVPRLLKAADIYCQPNLLPESFGITLVEALGAGLPVVATSMGGANEIIDDTCGLLVNPGADQVAATLRQLIEEPQLRRALAQGGPARARKLCDPTDRIHELSDLLTGLVASSQPVAQH